MTHRTMARRARWIAWAAAVALLALMGPFGCRRRPPVDTAGQQAMQSERDGRVRLREGTSLAVCDAALHFARERHLGRTSSDSRWARRGERYVARWAPECQEHVERFWARYEGCATPIHGREPETFHYWDQARVLAYQQYAMPGVAVAISGGRTRWQQACPADYAAAVAQEAALRVQAPLPVPVTVAPSGAASTAAPTAAAPSAEAQQALYQAVMAMANGQYQQALTALQTLHAAGATPIITFNIAVCHDQLGQRDEALAAYQQVATDTTFGPRAAARVRILGGETAAPSEDTTVRAREEFQRGLQLAEAGSYQQAIEAFNRSYAAVPHPRTIMNIAISYHRLGRTDAAISHYQLVVCRAPPPRRRTSTGFTSVAKSNSCVALLRSSSVTWHYHAPSSRLALLATVRFCSVSQTGRRSSLLPFPLPLPCYVLPMPAWHEDLFDERYLEFYEEVLRRGPAEEEVAFLDRAMALPAGARVLDLGCGVGRHAVPLARRGYHVTGVELSEVMVGHAVHHAEEAGVTVTLERRDMRDLSGLGPFDACVFLYTAFGYFDDRGNEVVLGGVRDALAPGGVLALDVTNPLSMMTRWPGDSWREVAAGVARERSRYDALTARLEARRTLYRAGGATEELPSSSVRMYSPHELSALLEGIGFEVEQLHGGYRGQLFDWKRSAVQVWIARRRS